MPYISNSSPKQLLVSNSDSRVRVREDWFRQPCGFTDADTIDLIQSTPVCTYVYLFVSASSSLFVGW